MLWISKIMAEIDAVTEEQANSLTTKNEGCPHEHVVGVLSLELKKLRFLVRDYSRREHDLAAKFVASKDEAEADELEKQFDSIEGKGELLKELFWTSVRDAFPELYGKTAIRIRTGDKVVWSEHGEQIQMAGGVLMALDELFSGGFHEPSRGMFGGMFSRPFR
jgi:hypothetical protein